LLGRPSSTTIPPLFHFQALEVETASPDAPGSTIATLHDSGAMAFFQINNNPPMAAMTIRPTKPTAIASAPALRGARGRTYTGICATVRCGCINGSSGGSLPEATRYLLSEEEARSDPDEPMRSLIPSRLPASSIDTIARAPSESLPARSHQASTWR